MKTFQMLQNSLRKLTEWEAECMKKKKNVAKIQGSWILLLVRALSVEWTLVQEQDLAAAEWPLSSLCFSQAAEN